MMLQINLYLVSFYLTLETCSVKSVQARLAIWHIVFRPMLFFELAAKVGITFISGSDGGDVNRNRKVNRVN